MLKEKEIIKLIPVKVPEKYCLKRGSYKEKLMNINIGNTYTYKQLVHKIINKNYIIYTIENGKDRIGESFLIIKNSTNYGEVYSFILYKYDNIRGYLYKCIYRCFKQKE